MEFIEIKIRNFAGYKGRPDVVNNSWFRMSNRILEDHEFFDFTGEELKVWIYLLCLSSQKNTDTVHVFYRHAHRVCGLEKQTIDSAIKKLKRNKCIDELQKRNDRGRYADDTQTCATRQDKTDKTEQDTALAPQDAVAENPVAVYCESYKEKYGHNPVIGGKQSGILARFAKNHPKAWPDLIRGYLQMPDTWAVARSHPVELLESKINEITRYLKTGKVVTQKVIQHAEEMIDKAQGTNRRPRKSLEELEAEKIKMLTESEKEGA